MVSWKSFSAQRQKYITEEYEGDKSGNILLQAKKISTAEYNNFFLELSHAFLKIYFCYIFILHQSTECKEKDNFNPLHTYIHTSSSSSNTYLKSLDTEVCKHSLAQHALQDLPQHHLQHNMIRSKSGCPLLKHSLATVAFQIFTIKYLMHMKSTFALIWYFTLQCVSFNLSSTKLSFKLYFHLAMCTV